MFDARRSSEESISTRIIARDAYYRKNSERDTYDHSDNVNVYGRRSALLLCQPLRSTYDYHQNHRDLFNPHRDSILRGEASEFTIRETNITTAAI